MQTHYGDMAKDENEYRERNKGGSDSVTLQLKRYEMEEVLTILKAANGSSILENIIPQIKVALGDPDGLVY